LFSFSDVLKTTNCTFQEVDLVVGIEEYDDFFSPVQCMCGAECLWCTFCVHEMFLHDILTTAGISPLDLPTMVSIKNVIRDDVWRAKTSNAQRHSAPHIQVKKIIIFFDDNYKIYLLQCAICGLQHIRETKQLFSKRLNGNRSDANCKPVTLTALIIPLAVRERPFNLKRGGYGFFLKKIFWFPKLLKKKFWSWWREKK
jgi:hypothetical protein